jgi:hypothetical protein
MVIFDGTMRVDEVFVIIFRWVTKEMIIYERCVEMCKYKHTFYHEELITAVIKILTQYNIFLGEANHQHLRCNDSHKELNRVKGHECLFRAMTHVGEHVKIPPLLKTKQDLCALTK